MIIKGCSLRRQSAFITRPTPGLSLSKLNARPSFRTNQHLIFTKTFKNHFFWGSKKDGEDEKDKEKDEIKDGAKKETEKDKDKVEKHETKLTEAVPLITQKNHKFVPPKHEHHAFESADFPPESFSPEYVFPADPVSQFDFDKINQASKAARAEIARSKEEFLKGGPPLPKRGPNARDEWYTELAIQAQAHLEKQRKGLGPDKGLHGLAALLAWFPEYIPPAKGCKIAVILSGAGRTDGSDLTESAAVIHWMDYFSAVPYFYAPDTPFETSDLRTGGGSGEMRNVLEESERFIGYPVKPLSSLKAAKYDGVIVVGGQGVMRVLSNAEENPWDFQLHHDLSRVLHETSEAEKTAAFLSQSVFLAAKFYLGVELMTGNLMSRRSRHMLLGLRARLVDDVRYKAQMTEDFLGTMTHYDRFYRVLSNVASLNLVGTFEVHASVGQLLYYQLIMAQPPAGMGQKASQSRFAQEYIFGQKGNPLRDPVSPMEPYIDKQQEREEAFNSELKKIDKI